MISFACPKCDCDLEASPKQVGTKVACPECGTKLIVPGATGKKSSGVTARPSPKAAPPPKTKPAPKRRQEEDYDDDDDAPPKRKAAQGKSNNLLVLGICLGAAVVVLGGLGILYLIFKEPANAGQPPIVMGPPGGLVPPGNPPVNPPVNAGPINPTPPKPADAPKETSAPATAPVPAPAEDVPQLSRAGSADPGQKVYQRLLKSVALILAPMQVGNQVGLSMGSGTLIDPTNRLVLTNYHVVGKSETTNVFFATFKDGKMETNPNYFLDLARKNQGIQGKPVWKDNRHDLALVQLEKLPDNVQALPLASSQPTVTQHVYSVGHPGASGGLWVYTEGKVRQLIRKKKWIAGDPSIGLILDIEADVVLTDSATNHGDSGGPLVNSRGEMVAVVQGGARDANSLSFFIDVGEVRGMLDTYSKQTSVKVALAESSGLGGGESADLPALIKLLTHKDANTRATAAQQIGDAGPGAKVALSELMKALADKEQLVRRMAMDSLNRIGAPDRSDLPMLTKGLKDPSQDVRIYAASAIGWMSADARSAVGELIEALKDSDIVVRQAAARALGKMGSVAKDKVIQALKETLKDGDKDVRVVGAEALTGLTPMTALDVPMLLEVVKHEDTEVRVQAIRSLGRLGADARGSVPTMTNCVKDKDNQVRRAALETLGLIGSEARDALPEVQKALKDSDKDVRRAAVESVGKMGGDAKAVVPLVLEALKDPDMRRSAIIALGRIGPPAKDATKEFSDILKETTDRELRMAIVTAVASIRPVGNDAPKLATACITLLEDREKDKELFDKTVEALGKLGRVAVPPLTKALNDSNRSVRVGAALALGDIGPDARAALPALEFLFRNDTNQDVKQACVRADSRIRR